MNSLSGGWWLGGRLYQFNDPDALVFDNGPDTNEDQSRLINGVITGVFLNGSILTNAASISLAQQCLTNAAINRVARAGLAFRPIDGATGTGAASIWATQNGATWCLAFFNYTSGPTNQTVNLSRAGLPAGAYRAVNLWDGTSLSAANSFTVSLNARQATLFQLTLQPGFARFKVNGTNGMFSGTNGVPGWPYSVLIATNVATPLSNWTPMATNNFDASGNFAFTNTVNPRQPQMFFQLQVQ